MTNPRSTASIAGHPIHPMLVAFPIAFFVATLACDITVSWYLRYTGGAAAVVPTGLILSLVAVGIMLFTGWKGWQVVYRHHVGVSDEQDVPYRQPHRTA